MAARRGHRPSQAPAGRPRFWGRHAVAAAFENPERVVRKIWATREASAALDIPADVPIVFAEVTDLARLVPGDAPHQGIVIEVDPLEDMWLADLLQQGQDDKRPLIVLDQVTDPHNVGAIMRSAAAFDALGIVTPDRHAPPESGTIARAASGALEIVPWVRVVNLARARRDCGSGVLASRADRRGDADAQPGNGHAARRAGAGGRGRRHAAEYRVALR